MAAVVASKVKRNRSSRARPNEPPEYDRFGRLVPPSGRGQAADPKGIAEFRRLERIRRHNQKVLPNAEYYKKVTFVAVDQCMVLLLLLIAVADTYQLMRDRSIKKLDT